MKPRLLVTFELPIEVRHTLAASFDVSYAPAGFRLQPGLVLDAVQGHSMILVSATQDRLNAELMAGLPNTVRAIATYSVGHDHIDLAAARARGIAIFSTPDVLSTACAEVGMLLLLGAARRVTESIDLLRSGNWQGWTPTQLNGSSLSAKVLGIVGMGRIGREIARRARSFDMVVHYANRSRLAPDQEQGATYHESPESLLRVAQFLMLACPATPQTTGFLNARTIELLPQGAIVANIGRGAVVVDADLVRALSTGRIAAAGLDVFNGEPEIFPGYAALPNVFMLPHIGSSTTEARQAMGAMVVQGFKAFAAGQPTPNRIA
jgi:glyoxylate reductase